MKKQVQVIEDLYCNLQNLKGLVLMSWCFIPQDNFSVLVKIMPCQVRTILVAWGTLYNIRQVDLTLWLIGVHTVYTYRHWALGTPVHLFIDAILQSTNYVAAVQCIKSYRYRSKASVDVDIKHQTVEKMWSLWLWLVIIVGSRWAGVSISGTANLLGFSYKTVWAVLGI